MKCFRLPDGQSNTPGYSEIRRHLLVGATASIAACLTSSNRLLAAINEAETDRRLDDFITATAEPAAMLKSDASATGQEAYVQFLAEAVSAVDHVSQDDLGSDSWKGLDPGVFLGASGRNKAFFVIQWHLEPGAFLPPHCHPKTSVCTFGLEGSSILRHFEAEATVPSYRDDRTTKFLIRETRRLELRAGSVSTLTEYRDNIHLFEAGKHGARGIDVTTDYGGDGSFSFLDFDHRRPLDRNERTYVARWIGTSLN